MNGAIYRFCRKCRKQVNVSALEKYDKKYICPRCAGQPWYQTREGMVKMKSNGINIEVHARRPWSGEASSVLWEGKAPPRMRSAEGPAEIQACLSCTKEDCSGNICRERTPHEGQTKARDLLGGVREKSIVSRFQRILLRYSLGVPTPGRLNITAFRRLPSVTGRSNWGCKNAQDQKLLQPRHAWKACAGAKAAGAEPRAGK